MQRKRQLTGRAINIYIRPIPWIPPSCGTAQPSSPTNNLKCFASPVCMFNGFFPARWGAGNSPHIHLSAYIYWLGSRKDTIFCSLPCYSCLSPSRFSGWFPPVGARSGTYSMYAPNKILPESAWRVGHNREVDCICHQACFPLSIFYFSDLLPRARSRSHLTPKGEYIRYRYLLRDTRNTCMYEKKWSIGGFLSTGRYRSSIRSGTL